MDPAIDRFDPRQESLGAAFGCQVTLSDCLDQFDGGEFGRLHG